MPASRTTRLQDVARDDSGCCRCILETGPSLEVMRVDGRHSWLKEDWTNSRHFSFRWGRHIPERLSHKFYTDQYANLLQELKVRCQEAFLRWKNLVDV